MESPGEKEEECVGMARLPEGCVACVLSLTSPADVCRSACTCREFRSAAGSDELWESFLPRDYREILARAVQRIVFRTKKELYLRLCQPVLIDSGRMSLTLDKSTGKKCFMISARELHIEWGNTPQYWTWISLPEARFSEVAELKDVCRFEIHGKISTAMLSNETTYSAYLVFRLNPEHYGFLNPPHEASIVIGTRSSTELVLLCDPTSDYPEEHAPCRRRNRWLRRSRQLLANNQFGPHLDVGLQFEPATSTNNELKHIPHDRDDGWMEVLLGEFFNGDGADGEVMVSLLEVNGGHWKSGLVVLGIDFRPKNKLDLCISGV